MLEEKAKDYHSGAAKETDKKDGVCIIKLFMAVTVMSYSASHCQSLPQMSNISR
jgi:hypothetical protein